MPQLIANETANGAVWLTIAFVLTWIAVKAVLVVVRWLGRFRWKEWIDAGIDAVDRPVILGIPSGVVYLLTPLAFTDAALIDGVQHGAVVAVIIAVGWLIVSISNAARRVVEKRYSMEAQDNLKARSVNTKFRVLQRVWIVLVVVITIGAVLMTFPSIRTIGAGLLASAGMAGLILGLAARPFVETMLASIQIALTEPINLDDVLIVEGEWGRVEEIRSTYVVMRIWDDRRLIIPLTYFITQPFQNWTRRTADIMGNVTVVVDYRTPVDAVRAAVKPMVEEDPLFDGRFWNVQISDADGRGMTLRVLCTASDASKAWDLRCAIREKLIAWLQEHHPDCLPRGRAELEGASPLDRFAEAPPRTDDAAPPSKP